MNPLATLWALPALAGFVLLGWGLDRVLGLALAPDPVARWALRAAVGVAATFALALHPAALGVLLAAALVARVHATRTLANPRVVLPRERADTVVLAALGVLVAIAMVRAPVPLYWDEFVWLWKSRVALGGWGALRAAALDPHAEIYPQGYPLLWSLMPAWFTVPSGRTPLALATVVPLALALMLWLTAARAVLRPAGDRAVGPLLAGSLLLAATPLLQVHLRSSYADLPVGLLASALALGEASGRTDASRAWASVPGRIAVAIILVGCKDEGLVHLLAVALSSAAFAFTRTSRSEGIRARTLRGALAVALGGAVPFVAWRALLVSNGVDDTHHALGDFALDRAMPLARAFAFHAMDTTSWGALWPLALGAGIAALVTRLRSRARMLVVTLGMQAMGLFLGLACGPERVREFAFGGSLLNRALVQLAPQAIAIVVVALASPDASSR